MVPEAAPAGELSALSEEDAQLMQDGCGCTQQCLKKFDSQEVINVQLSFLDMDTEEKSHYILFAIQSFCQTVDSHKQTGDI